MLESAKPFRPLWMEIVSLPRAIASSQYYQTKGYKARQATTHHPLLPAWAMHMCGFVSSVCACESNDTHKRGAYASAELLVIIIPRHRSTVSDCLESAESGRHTARSVSLQHDTTTTTTSPPNSSHARLTCIMSVESLYWLSPRPSSSPMAASKPDFASLHASAGLFMIS